MMNLNNNCSLKKGLFPLIKDEKYKNYLENILNYLNNLCLENDYDWLDLDIFSPFIYKIFVPDFQLRKFHNKNIIFQNRFLKNSDSTFILQKQYTLELNCSCKSVYFSNYNDIILNINWDNFYEFINTKQIKILSKPMSFENMLFLAYAYEKSFDNFDKKIKGYLNFPNELFKLEKLQINNVDLDCSFIVYNNEIVDFCKRYFSVSIYNNLMCIKPTEKTFNYVNDFNLQFINLFDFIPNYFLEKVFLDNAEKLNKSKKNLLIEIFSKTKSKNILKKLINEFSELNIKDLNKSLENISKTKNYLLVFKTLEKIENLSGNIDVIFINLDYNPVINFNILKFHTKIVYEILETYKYSANLNFVIGKLENINFYSHYHDYMNNIISEKEDIILNIKNSIKEKEKKGDILLIASAKIKTYYYGYKIIELNTRNLLEEEGKFQKHCVSGHYDKINENCRIFSIRDEKNKVRHTVELIKHGNKWVTQMSQGFKNCPISSYDEEIQTSLSAVINFVIKELDKQNKPLTNEDIKNMELLNELDL